jgi:hypothetical protein
VNAGVLRKGVYTPPAHQRNLTRFLDGLFGRGGIRRLLGVSPHQPLFRDYFFITTTHIKLKKDYSL